MSWSNKLSINKSNLHRHEGAVANVDIKLYRSSLDGHRVHRKVETFSSEAKIVRIGAGSFKSFLNPPEKGTDGLSFFALEGKILQRIRISARKRPLSPGLSKQQCPSLTLSIESYDKHLNPPPPPPKKKQKKKTKTKTKNDEIGQIDFRNQAR